MQNKDKNIVTIADFTAKSGKTKDAVKELSIENGKNYLVVVAEKTPEIIRATNNIANVKVVRPTYLNVFDILNADKIVITEKSLPVIENWLLGKEAK
jgi:large subunit ribosomal protein L4